MKSCPYCNASLEENASFCLYCMRELSKKKTAVVKKSRRPKAKVVIAVLLVCFIMGAAIGLIMAFTGGDEKPRSNDKEEGNIQETTDALEKEEEEKESVICNFEDFQLRCIYLSGKNSLTHLFDAGSFVNTHSGKDRSGDTWDIYQADTHLPGVGFSVSFCEGGEEIITAVTGISGEAVDEALKICMCAVESVYNYSYTNLYEFLSDREKYPMSEADPSECVLLLAGLPDPSGKKNDEGTDVKLEYTASITEGKENAEEYLYFQKRTRVYEGKEVYDIFLLHTGK
ncbi:MAG: hypothetical protein E7575_00445 [Ruminococcaceae bacterium]|nr:hypothetical protein [Oscillospiraceae bacterium]